MKSWSLAAFLTAGLLLAAPAAYAQLEVPAAWAGIWEFSSMDHDCGSTGGPITVDTDTLCAFQPFEVEEEGMTLDCSGTITDTAINVTCTGEVIEGPCTVTFTFTTVGTRSGDSYTGTDTFEITYVGCGPIQDQCQESDVTGTRIAPEPGSCNSPTLPTTWGRIKAQYDLAGQEPSR